MKHMKQFVAAISFLALLFVVSVTTVSADDASDWHFKEENGRKYYTNGKVNETLWRLIDGKYYYFDGVKNGAMVVGWQLISPRHEGATIAPYPNGMRLELAFRPEWYYFDQNGVLQEYKGKQLVEARTALNTDKLFGDKYQASSEKRNYYFTEDNHLMTGWVKDTNWYFLDDGGSSGFDRNFANLGEIKKGWLKDGSTWYYLNPSDGVMQTGWQKVNGRWYYLRSSGAMATDWLKDGSTWYYLDATNGDMKTGWVYVGNTWYYLRSSGAMETGWVYVGNKWYYLRSSGAMEKGWVYLGNTWYYLENSGAMKTGWFQANGKWYYAYSSGALAVNTTVDGYRVNSNGEWVR